MSAPRRPSWSAGRPSDTSWTVIEDSQVVSLPVVVDARSTCREQPATVVRQADAAVRGKRASSGRGARTCSSRRPRRRCSQGCSARRFRRGGTPSAKSRLPPGSTISCGAYPKRSVGAERRPIRGCAPEPPAPDPAPDGRHRTPRESTVELVDLTAIEIEPRRMCRLDCQRKTVGWHGRARAPPTSHSDRRDRRCRGPQPAPSAVLSDERRERSSLDRSTSRRPRAHRPSSRRPSSTFQETGERLVRERRGLTDRPGGRALIEVEQPSLRGRGVHLGRRSGE